MDAYLKETLLRAAPPPTHARHVEYSMLLSLDDEPWGPSPALLTIALEAARRAQEISLISLRERMAFPPFYAEVWPGEHYRLLAGLVDYMKPRLVIEIGTGTGLSALALRSHLGDGARIVTFDVVHWQSVVGSVLRYEDFEDGAMTFLQEDLTDAYVVERHRALLEDAQVIFIDAAKDGLAEEKLLRNLASLQFRVPPLVVLDDIRLWNMLRIWRHIAMPKLDLTSFGHWSGTGFVEWRVAEKIETILVESGEPEE